MGIQGVTEYQIKGQEAVEVVASTGPSGTVTYNGEKITVQNGIFTLNHKVGRLDKLGNITYDGQTGNILSIAGVSEYQIAGQTPVKVTPISGPSGFIYYKGMDVRVNNGVFTLSGSVGTVDASGLITYL